MTEQEKTVAFLLTQDGRAKVRAALDAAHSESFVIVDAAPAKVVTVEDFLSAIEASLRLVGPHP